MMIREHTKETIIQKLNGHTSRNQRIPNTHGAKVVLIRVGLLTNECSLCKITNWKGKKLSLHLDHVDGNPRNNRLDNLRLLCPNCHSQTDTYCGRNNKNRKDRKKYFCLDCKKQISSWGTRCKRCHYAHMKFMVLPEKDIFCSGCEIKISNKSKSGRCIHCFNASLPKKTKIDWKPKKELIQLLITSNTMEKLAEDLGVSSNAIRKHCRKHNIDYKCFIKQKT